jgi:hypothetical protein
MAACYKHPSQAVSIHFAPPTSTTTTNNSRQAYASFLNYRQFYGVRGDKIPHFSLLTSCLKEGFRGKIMSSEAAGK